MKVYYAHFMGIYNTPQEKRDIQTLEELGLEVVNPNLPNTQNEVDEALTTMDYMSMFDKIFLSKVRNCEVFAFKALPDGRIPSGVAMELLEAQTHNKTIIELPSGMNSRMMDKVETREYLHDIGER